MIRFACVSAAVAAFASTACAEFTVNINEVGSDVVVTGSGALDLSAWTYLGDIGGDFTAGIRASYIALGPDVFNSDNWTAPLSFSGTSALPANPTFATTVSGDSVWFNWSFGAMYLPQGSVSGSTLTLTDTYAGETYASMGLVAGESYTWTWDIVGGGRESFTINVPAPASAALLGLGGFLAARRRR